MSARVTSRRRRPGISLIELLVVIAIMGLLAVTVLANVSNTAEARRGREAVRMLTSFIAKAQARALGGREFAGFMLAPVGPASYAAADIFLVDVPPVYRGDTVPALLTVSATSVGGANGPRLATGTNGQLLLSGTWDGGAGVRGGDLIRFDGRGPLYEIDFANSFASTPLGPAVTGTSVRFEFRGDSAGAREDAGFQAHNTPWPVADSPIPFEVFLQPVAVGSPLAMPEGRVVDLGWSGYGPPAASGMANTYQFFSVSGSGAATAGATTSILYDGTGRVRQVQVAVAGGTGPTRLTVTGAIFLLVGRADRAGQPYDDKAGGTDDGLGANWQYLDSHWIAIDPFTGVARSAPCANFSEDLNGNDVLDIGEDYNGDGQLNLRVVDPVSSQRWIRESLLSGGG